MSYTIYLEIDTGKRSMILFDALAWNYTSNCAPMWRAAGADLAEFHGKTAAECAPILRAAITEMKTNPDTYRAMNPPNGWGSYETLLPKLEKLLHALEQHPKTTIDVSH